MKQDPWLFRISLIASAVFTGAASLWIGLRQSVWFDEAYSIMLAKQPVAELVRLTSIDVHPPLYYLTLKAWAGVFGWSELALRILSVAMLIAALVVAVLLIRRMFSAQVATLAAPVIALAPLLIRYGFEIRMYAMASLVGIAATYLLFRAVSARGSAQKWWLLGYGVLIALGLYVQYFLALVWIVHVVWLAFLLLKKPISWQKIRPFLTAYLGGALLFLPWLATFIRQSSNGALAPIGQPLDFEQLSGVLTFNLFYQPAFEVGVGVTALLILLALLIFKGTRKMRGTAQSRRALGLLAAYIAVPLAVLMLLSLTNSMYTERYVSHISIGLVMLLAVTGVTIALRQAQTWRKIGVLAVFYGVFLVGFFQVADVGNFNFQRWETPTVKQAAAAVNDCGGDSQLLAAGPYTAIELDYYLPDCDVSFISEWDELGGGYAPLSGSPLQVKSVDELSEKAITYIFYDDPEHSLEPNYRLVESHEFGKLNVARFEKVNEE